MNDTGKGIEPTFSNKESGFLCYRNILKLEIKGKDENHVSE